MPLLTCMLFSVAVAAAAENDASATYIVALLATLAGSPRYCAAAGGTSTDIIRSQISPARRRNSGCCECWSIVRSPASVPAGGGADSNAASTAAEPPPCTRLSTRPSVAVATSPNALETAATEAAQLVRNWDRSREQQTSRWILDEYRALTSRYSPTLHEAVDARIVVLQPICNDIASGQATTGIIPTCIDQYRHMFI